MDVKASTCITLCTGFMAKREIGPPVRTSGMNLGQAPGHNSDLGDFFFKSDVSGNFEGLAQMGPETAGLHSMYEIMGPLQPTSEATVRVHQ